MTIPKRQEALERFIAEHFPEPAHDPRSNGGHARNRHAPSLLSDAEIISRCRRAKNAGKFENLFDHGDASTYGHDASRADQALVSLLVFYTDDPEQIDRLFRRSALYRPEKWGRRPDYRRRTIKHALDNRKERYDPKSHSYIGDWDSGSTVKGENRRPPLRSVRFNEIPDPGPRRYLLDGLIPEGCPTLLHGDGGVAKSMLALSFGLAVAREADNK